MSELDDKVQAYREHTSDYDRSADRRMLNTNAAAAFSVMDLADAALDAALERVKELGDKYDAVVYLHNDEMHRREQAEAERDRAVELALETAEKLNGADAERDRLREALIIHDGDIVVLECDKQLSQDEAEYLSGLWQKHVHARPIILSGGIHVARVAEPDAVPEAKP